MKLLARVCLGTNKEILLCDRSNLHSLPRFNLSFTCVGAKMGPPFVVISLPSMLQRETCANGSMHFDDRDDNDDEQVIRMN